MNLNNTPSAGKLTGAELARQRWEKRVGFVPDGCDEQGRVEAAHAASEIGTEEDRADPLAVFVGMRNGLLLMLAVALVVSGIAALFVSLP